MRSISLVALILAVSVLVVHARVVLGGKTWDDVTYHTEVAPPRLAAADAIADGQLPQWWDGTGLGVPLLAEPSHGAAYPLLWLARGPLALDLVLLAHLVWLALGIALWARRLGATELGAVIAGVLVAASGMAASMAIRGALPALAHLPWVGWAASGLARSDPAARHRATLAVGICIGAIGLAGQLAILVDAIALASVIAARRSTWRWLAAGLGAGLAIGALQWVPAALVIPDGAGAVIDGLKLSRLVELVVPGSFGATSPERAVPAIAGTTPVLPSLYVGASVFALATLARASRRTVGLGVAIAIVAGITGRGGWPAWFGAPEQHLAVLAVLAAAHAAIGVDALVARERRARLALGGAVLATAIGLVGVAVLRGRVDAPALDRALVDGGLGLACLVAALAIAWRVRPGPASAADSPVPPKLPPSTLAIAALVVAPSVGALGTTAPLADRAAVATTPAWADAASTARDGLAPLRVFRPLSLFEDTSPSSVADAVATLSGTIASRFRLASARSEDPARPPLHDRVWLAAAGVGGALLERYGIPLAILPVSLVEGRSLVELARRANWALVRFPASPPAALVGEWIWIDDDASAIARLFPPGAGRGLPPGLLVLRGQGAPHQDEPRAPEPCTIVRWTPGAIDLTCLANDTAYAVVSSTPAAGWTVHVAGRPTPWVTADLLRRAVAVDAGTHVISWRYVTPGLYLALALVAFGIVVLAGIVAIPRVTRRRTRDQP